MNTFLILIPALVVLITVLVVFEIKIGKRKNIQIYNFSDSFTNFFCGMLERVFDVFFSVIALYVFYYVYEHYAIFNIPSNAFTWVIGLLLTDFIAYWFHRWSHHVNFLWAAHIVHHQSEDLNITTVFRVSFFAVVFRACFFVWMAFIGFDVFIIVTTSLFLGIYQLFTHSRVIGNLGIVEYFLTTPSHHRVHHARNEKYMDRNYAHIFIFWDRIFGTFKEEEEEPKYGITSGFDRANAYNATFSYWKNLVIRARKTQKLQDKIKVFIKGPRWTPDDVDHLEPVFSTNNNGERLYQEFKLSLESKWYTFFSTIITIVCFVSLMGYKSSFGDDISIINLISNHHIVILLLIILFSIYVHTRTIESKKNAFLLELIRLVFIPICIFFGFKDVEYVLILSSLSFCYSAFLIVWSIRILLKKKNSNAFSKNTELQLK